MIVHVLRKPLTGTVAANALQHGCGALNIDECRVSLSSDEEPEKLSARSGGLPDRLNRSRFTYGAVRDLPAGWDCSKGRWPANLVHDGDANAVFPEAGNGWKKNYGAEIYAIENRQYGGGSFGGGGGFFGDSTYADSGSAARFFQQVTIK